MPHSQSHLIWEEIDLDCIAQNVRALRGLLSDKTGFMAVVKANGYGHGSVQVARCAIANGASMLGVARIEEALELRSVGINDPILIFGFTPANHVGDLLAHNLTATIYTREMAQAYSNRALSLGGRISVHLKVDTGMGRVGFVPEALGDPDGCFKDDLEYISLLPGIKCEGIYTHFASSDSSDLAFTREQWTCFNECLDLVDQVGMSNLVKHAACSAGIIRLPEAHLDMVRVGIAMYGLYPSRAVERDVVKLRPALSIKSRVIQLKRVPAGFKVSYGSTHVTKKETVIASVSVGYADGFSRSSSSNGEMLVRGKRAPVIGRVCMDQLLLDVGHISNVCVEDEVVVLGRQGGEEISADEIADRLSTINYEVVSTIMPRVPKIYL